MAENIVSGLMMPRFDKTIPNLGQTVAQLRQIENQEQDRAIQQQNIARQQAFQDEDRQRQGILFEQQQIAMDAKLAIDQAEHKRIQKANAIKQGIEHTKLTNRILGTMKPTKESFEQGMDVYASMFGEDEAQKIRRKYKNGFLTTEQIDQAKRANTALNSKLEAGYKAVSTPGKILQDAMNLPEGPGKQALLKELDKRGLAKGQMIESTPDGGFRVISGDIGQFGGKDLQRSTKGKIEKEIASDMNVLANLSEIKEFYNRDYLTYLGRLDLAGLRLKSKAGIELSQEEKDFLGNAKVFTQGINRVFNQYRKEITGAAASVREIEDLKKSVLNPDLAPDEFDASFKSFEDSLKRSMRIKRMVLRDGVMGRSKKQIGKDIDNAFMNGGDVPASEIDARGYELEKKFMSQGLSAQDAEAKVVSILKEEGYL